MVDIYLPGRQKVGSIFRLLGEHENDITYSVAWVLAQCPPFLGQFLRKAFGSKIDTASAEIRLQQHETKGGITDIEIEDPDRFSLIVEAKRGWTLPSRSQLEKHAYRVNSADH